MKKQFLETGKITGTHGIRGMVRIQAWCDDYDFLKKFKTLYLDKNGVKSLTLEKIQPNGNVMIAKFRGIDTIENAEKLRNSILYINRDDANLPDGAYFIQDLIGCTVFDDNSKQVYGTVSDVTQTGANDVWHIKNGDNEYLIPVIDDVVKQVDVESGEIYITPLKGIFDDEN